MDIVKVDEVKRTVTLKCSDGIAQTVNGLVTDTADGIKEAVVNYCQSYDAGKARVATPITIAPEELVKVRAMEGKTITVKSVEAEAEVIK